MGGFGTAPARERWILHDDADYELAARNLPEIRARRVVGADE